MLCNIQDGHILVSNKHAVISTSPLGVRLGHIVVATRKHAESFAELSLDEIEGLMKTLGQVLVAAEKALPAERIYVLRVNDKLAHLHFHLIPRQTGDDNLGTFIFGESGWSKTLAQAQSTKETELFASKFKRNFEAAL